jgi:TolB-like protein
VEGFRRAREGASTRVASTAGSSSVGARPRSIAVLPFTDLSAARDQAWFCDGIAEELINALTRVPDLKVTARTSAFAFRGKEQDIRRIGEALDVATVLEGSVRRVDNRIRLTAQLIDVTNGYHRWSARYDRELTDVFAVQDEISNAIVETLKLTLSGAKPPARQSRNLEAYEAYLRGRHQLVMLTRESVDRARRYFEEALLFDPLCAPAHADLAGCLVVAAEQGHKPASEMMSRARSGARRAVELDDDSPEGHHWLARVASQYDYDWIEAVREYNLAVASPSVQPSTQAAAAQFVLLPLGRYDEAIAAMEAAIRVDPLSPLPRLCLSSAYRIQGDVERAGEVLAPVPDSVPWKSTQLGLNYSAMNRTAEAIEAFERALLGPSALSFFSTAVLAANYARASNEARRRELLARLDLPEHALSRSVSLAVYHLTLSEFDEAARHLRHAIEDRNPWAALFATLVNTDFPHTAPGRAVMQTLNLGSRP